MKSKKDGPLKISKVGAEAAVLKMAAIICEAKERTPFKDLKWRNQGLADNLCENTLLLMKEAVILASKLNFR